MAANEAVGVQVGQNTARRYRPQAWVGWLCGLAGELRASWVAGAVAVLGLSIASPQQPCARPTGLGMTGHD